MLPGGCEGLWLGMEGWKKGGKEEVVDWFGGRAALCFVVDAAKVKERDGWISDGSEILSWNLVMDEMDVGDSDGVKFWFVKIPLLEYMLG